MSSNDIIRSGLLLVAKSGKRKSKGGRNSFYRWYTFFDEGHNMVFSIPGDLNLKLSIFGIATVTYKSERRSSWNEKYDSFIIQNMIAAKKLPNRRIDQFLDGELPKKLSCFGLIDSIQTGKLQIDFEELFRWRDVEFGDGYIRTKTPEIVLPSEFFPTSPIFMGYFNNINKGEEPIKGGFELSGRMSIGMVKTDGQWGVGYSMSTNTKLELISYELNDLKRAETVAVHDKAYFRLVAWAYKRLDNDKHLDPAEIDAEAERLGLTGVSPDALIEEVCMKPEYKKEFYTFIKDLGISTYATKDGFFITLSNGNIIWEMPKYGASTYVFGSQDPHLLMQRLRVTQRSKIYSDDAVGSALKYIGRRKHPESDENGEYQQSWEKDVKELAGV